MTHIDTEQFIIKYANEDIRSLALKASKYPDVDMPYALDQISGRHAALKKLPTWASIEGIIYPPHISMEQCSSEFTALYKQKILTRIVGDSFTMTDLTGGFGVDFIYMSEYASHAVYVERNLLLCKNAKHNISLFRRENAKVVNAQAEDYLYSMSPSDIIYIDPARRNSSGARTYAISDCTPDIIKLLPSLLNKARYVLVKLSPMLDHNKTVSDLNALCKCVKEVHIVSVAGECKELLLLLTQNASDQYKVYCTNDNSEFTYTSADSCLFPLINREKELSGMYIYEPNASIMKSGCFGMITKTFDVSAVASSSNLFVSREKIKDFPGRSFQIRRMTTMNKKELADNFKGIDKANITVRNFPLSVSELRKRLKVGDGGSIYVFATTNIYKTHILLICDKI